MKRKLAILFTLALTLLFTLAFSSCGDNDTTQTEHVCKAENWVVTKEPTCTERGESQGYCSCGQLVVRKKFIDELGHTEGEWVEKTATCTSYGSKYKKCTVCDSVIESETYPALGHTPKWTVIVEPTCTSTGTETGECTTCGDDLGSKTIRALGHSEGEWVIDQEPTCINTGKQHKNCTVCGEVDVDLIPAFGHNERIIEGYAATCTTTGLSDGKECIECGEILDEQEILEALGHVEKIIPAIEPTCVENGLSDGKKCSRCREILVKQENINALGHDFKNNRCLVCDEWKTSDGLEYSLRGDGTYYCVVDVGSCTDKDIVIPSTYNNLPVKRIGKGALTRRDFLTSVMIPSSVTYIENEAFAGCESLTIYCERKSNQVSWPEDWNKCDTFSDCPVVWDCNNNDIADNGYIYMVLDGIRYAKSRYDNDVFVTRQPINLTTAIIPNSIMYKGISYPVKGIVNYAFSECESLKNVTIEGGIRSIGSYAFEGCTSLISITIPAGVTSIGNYVFYNCASPILYCVEYEAMELNTWGEYWNRHTDSMSCPVVWNCEYNDIANNGYIYTVIDGIKYAIKNNVAEVARNQPRDLTKAIIPDSIMYKETSYPVTSIGWLAFENCDLLTSVTTGDSVQKISDAAFSDCDSLTSIIFGKGITSISNSAFENCSLLEYNEYDNAYYLGNEINPYLCLVKSKDDRINSCIVNENTKIIISCAFYNCSRLTSITIPESVTSIGRAAFSCCTSLTSITIPDSVTTMGDGVFYACSNLCYVSIGNGVSAIGESTFHECRSLMSIVLPDSVTSIGHYAFKNCTALTSITIGKGVTSIGIQAFLDCRRLTKIIIPNSVISIGRTAFSDCTVLTIYCEASEPASGWDSTWNPLNRPVVWGHTEE